MRGGCTNRCDGHVNPPGRFRDHYRDGYRYCRICDIFVAEGLRCYCCNRNLRLSPRSKRNTELKRII